QTQTINGSVAEMIAPEQPVITSNKFAVKVFSNPTTTSFSMMITGSEEEITIIVFDQVGRKVQTLTRVKANASVSIGSNYTAGAYTAIVTQGLNKAAVKLIKVSK
ncbi:MAG: Secretion protein Por, partial [Segetibacter sp.]|nr:Secretion protein Por [Segetibacter sp.]